MKSLKKLFVACLVLSMMVMCLAGCMNIDMGVVIKEDGTATVSTKLMIEEDAYNSLLALENLEGAESADTDDVVDAEDEDDAEVVDDAEGGVSEATIERPEPTPSEDEEVDLKDFKKETINDKVYYTYEKSMTVASYAELESALITDGDDEGVDVFSDVKVSKESNRYSFQATTTAMEEDETGMMPSNWLAVTLTVTMPGEIVETTGEKIDGNTVRFALEDFSAEQSMSVVSETPSVDVSKIILIVVVGAIFVGCVAYLVVMKKKKGSRS